MQERETLDLETELDSTHLAEYTDFVQRTKDSLLSDATSFSTYIKEILREKGIKQLTAFMKADIPERYGYKLLSGEKRTRQRDILLRICYASELTLRQTRCALRKYGVPDLYVKDPRDILLMIAFNERPGTIADVDALLKQNGLEPLRSSGKQE